jgi:EAL domain-containing protein (putative c-di-GMP-specific phosphodiesterase class I)
MVAPEAPMFTSEFSIENGLLEGRLRFLYEPRFSPRSQRITGAHGVLCWDSGLHGWVDIERTAHLSSGQLARLWQWKLTCIDRAFAALRALPAAEPLSPSLSLSLSLSSVQLHSHEWVERMLETIDRTKMPASRIEVELIDKGPVLDARLAETAFDILRRKGVGLVLNDFAMSPAGFERLSHHAFGKVKLGKAWLPAMHETPSVWSRKRDMLLGLIHTAKELGAEAVLDGIRLDTHLDSLRGLPVAEWRGPYWGKTEDPCDLADHRSPRRDEIGAAC